MTPIVSHPEQKYYTCGGISLSFSLCWSVCVCVCVSADDSK